MKKALKIAAIILASIFVLITAVIATIPLWFPVEKVRHIIIDELSEKTGREVSVKSLSFNILKGFELKGFVIKESKRYGNRDFIRDDSIVMRYNLIALLGRELVVDKFELVSPYINVIREKDGRYNFSDIIEKMNAEKAEKAAKSAEKGAGKKLPAKKSAASGKVSAIKNIIITSVGIKDGNFIFADYSKAKPSSVKIHKLNLSVENIVMAAVKPIGISMDCTLLMNEYKIPVSLKSSLSADLIKKTALIDVASFNVAGISTSGKVNILDFKDAKGTLTSVSNVKKMLEVLPPDLAAKAKDVNASIDITNTLNFAYASSRLAFSDVLKLENGVLVYKNGKFVENLSGRMTVNSDYEMSANVSMLLAGNEVKIKASGKDINAPKDSVYRVDISSPKFAVEYLLALFPKKEKVAAKTGAAVQPKKNTREKKKTAGLPGVYLTLNAGSIYYKTLNTGKTTASIRFVNSKLYSELAMMCYEGAINSSAVMDINTEGYTLTADIRGVKVNSLIDDAISIIPKKNPEKKSILDDIKNKVYGSLYMESKFWGSTFSEPALTIAGEGKFNVKNGRIAATDTGKDLSSKFGMTFLSQDIPFDTMAADFNMLKGKINARDFKVLNGPNGEKGMLKIRGNGYVTVDRSLDFKLETDINPHEARQLEEYFARNLGIRDIGYAYNRDGWMPFDIRIYGSMIDKKYDLNQKRMMDNIGRNLTNKAVQEGAKYLEEKGKDIIKNLFKK